VNCSVDLINLQGFAFGIGIVYQLIDTHTRTTQMHPLDSLTLFRIESVAQGPEICGLLNALSCLHPKINSILKSK